MSGIDIVVVGSINMDLVFSAPNLPEAGETVKGAKFSTHAGGKGANQAVAATRMGAATAMVGCVGNDLWGQQLLKSLQVNGVHCQAVKTVAQASGCAGIFVDNQGANYIVVAPGANDALLEQEIKSAADLIASAKVMLVQREIPGIAVTAALDVAGKAGVVTILDPAPALGMSPDLLRDVDYITPNAQEAKALTGINVHCWTTAAKAAQRLRDLGVKNVIITMGRLGAYFCSALGSVRIGTPSVEAVDSTGAGDAFNGALAAALVQGAAPDQAADVAAVAGALTVSKAGAQSSLPTRDQVAKLVCW